MPQPENAYTEIVRRMNTLTGSTAAMISGLTIIAIWGRWEAMAYIAGIQVVVVGFNVVVNLVLLPRYGPSIEIARTAVNLSSTLLGNHLAGWPVTVWLWLPFVALAFDHLDPRVALGTLIAFCVAQDGLALLEGIPWIYPLTFTAFAIFCSEASRIRFSVIREMLAKSDLQRAAITESNAELRAAHARVKLETQNRLRMEVEVRQAHKLEAVGRLAAGVAHEINTPVQFVNDSIHFLRDATSDLMQLVVSLQGARQSALDGMPVKEAAAVAAAAEVVADLPYLVENVPKAFECSIEGLSRVAAIVSSLKEFAHPDSTEMTSVDLNRAIASTLTIARNEYKFVAEVETHFEDLPLITCHIGEINQVVLNIVVNAAHAIADVVQGSDRKGVISVRTHLVGDDVVIEIGDTGGGIPERVRDRLYDPFFTTKVVGKGTGQGLAMARSIVVDKHQGELRFETEMGVGTTFFIRLAVAGAPRRTGIMQAQLNAA